MREFTDEESNFSMIQENLLSYVNIPDELLDKMEGDWHKEMFADFLVCPFRDDEPGVMRPICVESAENIFVRDIPEK